jgi:hypothetical protein
MFETVNGMLGCIIDEDDKVKIEVEYIGTKASKISLIISIISIVGLGVYVYKKR